MKTKKIITAGMIATAVLATGCSDDFLEVQNPTGEPLEEYYTTDAHIQESLAAAYDPIHWPDWGLGQYNALNIDAEIMGDDFWVGGANKADMQNWHKLFNFEADENNTLSSLWTVDYSGVKRCNDLLQYISEVPEGAITAENRASYIMQARCLRVFYYNMLWHYFGNVPFYLENLSTPPYTAPQLKADEVYDQLIVELEDVIASKALPMKWGDTDAGRMSQAVAYMLYAEMVMYQNDQSSFGKALEYMNAIISSGKYALNPDFAAIWASSGEWCSESIWEINYEDGISERDWGSPLAIGGTVMPTLISPNGWPGDADWGPNQDGWGFMPLRVSTYDMFAANDKRRAASCWDVRDLADDFYTKRYQDTHLWLQKYRPFNANNVNSKPSKNLNYNNNYRYYRYAEALLNAAELSLRTGGSATGDAKTWFNLVRNRAGLASLDKVTLNDIFNERHFEFVGEGKRYWDLVRAEGISEVSSANKATTALVPDEFGYRTNSWTINKKHIPIAQAELNSDPALVQNAY